MSVRLRLTLGLCCSLLACERDDAPPAAVNSAAEVASTASSAPPPKPPPTPDEVFRTTIIERSKKLPDIAKTRRFPFNVDKGDAPPKAPANPSAPPLIVQLTPTTVLVDGKTADTIKRPKEPEKTTGAAAATNPKANVTVSSYGPPTPLPGLRKALAKHGGAVAGLKVLTGVPNDVMRGTLDALRREGYRDVFLWISDDPSLPALVRVIWTTSREGMTMADEHEWYLAVQYFNGKANVITAKSADGTSTQTAGVFVDQSELSKAVCETWQTKGQHQDPDDPISDALVINTLRATPELLHATIAAATACKRSNGKPALWVGLRQMTSD